MSMKRVYIAGKISGLDYELVKVKFTDANTLLLFLGYTPVTPIFLCKAHWNWWRCMAVCLWNLAQCDYIFLLPDWNNSKGARIERKFARLFNIKELEL